MAAPTIKLYLASSSPRRRELLRQLGVSFDVVPTDVPETVLAGESAHDYVSRVARAKAIAAAAAIDKVRRPARPVLAADTCVVLDGHIMGKPRNRRDGEAMLGRLAGNTHQVLTGVHVLSEGEHHAVVNTNQVTFGELTPAQITRYWDTGEPADKAGGYAIQGRAAAFISHIEGSYTGIVGLPLFEVVRLLGEVGVEIL